MAEAVHAHNEAQLAMLTANGRKGVFSRGAAADRLPTSNHRQHGGHGFQTIQPSCFHSMEGWISFLPYWPYFRKILRPAARA